MSPPLATHCRRGFALLTVLWVIAGTATIALALELSARDGQLAARNRVSRERAHWIAFGCLEEWRSAADLVLTAQPDAQDRKRVWRELPRHLSVPIASSGAPCSLGLEAVGSRVDLNSAEESQLVALFAVAGLGTDRSDLAQAILDWRDADDSPRPRGAEAPAYEALASPPPRNGPFAAPSELALVRGLASHIARLDLLVGVRPRRISLDHAPREVLATLPGFSTGLVDRILERRAIGQRVDDLRDLIDLVSGDAADRIRERYPELVRMAVADTEGWVVTIEAAVGAPAATVILEAELSLTGSRTSQVRWSVR